MRAHTPHRANERIEMPIVIYGLQCLQNGFTYVGRSTDHRRRWRVHRRLLQRGVHTVAEMLADWQKFGESGFAVQVLEVLPHDVELPGARAAELRWHVHFARLGLLYNAPACPMCNQPYDLGAMHDFDLSDETASRKTAAPRARKPHTEKEVPGEAAHEARVQSRASEKPRARRLSPNRQRPTPQDGDLHAGTEFYTPGRRLALPR
jgi:hypothetical protein